MKKWVTEFDFNSLSRKDTHNMNINDGEFFYYQYAAKSQKWCKLFSATLREVAPIIWLGGGGKGGRGWNTSISFYFLLGEYVRGVVREEVTHQLLSPNKLNNILLQLGFQFILK